jgi:NADPH-dependent ferric siderophore reductase
MTILGPTGAGDSVSITWRPPATSGPGPAPVLLAADETAVPAVGAILESLPAGYRGHAVLEVPDAGDFQQLRTAADLQVTWLARGAHPHGERLVDAVRQVLHRPGDDPPPAVHQPAGVLEEPLWEVPGSGDAGPPFDGCYAWVAGETGMVRELRSVVKASTLERRQTALMGYWRRGRAEGP